MTKPVTRKMVVDWFIDRANRIAISRSADFCRIVCSVCGMWILNGEDVQWDHIHADVFDGPHEYQNLRPVHAECHKKKTARDIKDNAKIKRLTGQTKTGPKKRLPSKPFEKRTQPYVWPKRSMRRHERKTT